MPDYTTIIESGSLGISTIATNLSTTSVAVAVGFIGATGPIGSGFDLSGPNNGLITRNGLEGNVAVAEAGFTYDPNGTGYLSGKFGINTNNPTFTLDVVGSGNFSSGVYGSSVSIGTTTSTALLTVGNNSSTIAASGLAFGNDSGANLYRSATSTIKTDGNFLAMGSVGIGAAAPLYKLDVNGTAQVDFLRIGYSSNQGTITYGAGLGMVVKSASSQPLSLGAGGRNSDIRILATDGNVGIGTTTPTGKLEAYGTGDISVRITTSGNNATTDFAALRFFQGGVQKGSVIANSGVLRIGAGDGIGATSGVFVTSAAAVGISTSSPTQKLDISGGNIQLGNTYGIYSRLTNGTVVGILSYNSSNLTRVGANGEIELGGYVAFKPTGAERMRIMADGNVGIGTTTPGMSLEINSANQLRLKQSEAGGAYFDFISTSTSHGAGLGKFVITYNGGSTSTPPFAIDISGNVGIGTSTPASKLSLATHTAASGGITFGTDTNLYRSSAATIKTDGNFLALGSGNFSSGVYSSGNIVVTGSVVRPTETGVFATATNLASTESTLTTSISNLSGTLTGGYATIANLASTGSTLNAKVDTLSGYANTTFATITNLASTGSTLNTKINTLSGYANTTFATITNLASTGSTLNAKRLSTLSSSYTSNGTGQTTSGEWIRVATSVGASAGRAAAWISVAAHGGSTTPISRAFYVSKDYNNPGNGAISLLHQTISSDAVTSIRLTYDTGTSRSNIDILCGLVMSGIDTRITVINDDSMGGHVYQSMYSGVTGLTPSENVVTSLNLTHNVVFGVASKSLGANAFVFNSSGIVVTGNRLIGQNDTGVFASVTNLASTGSTLTTSIANLSGTLTGSYVRLNESRPTVTSSSVSIGTATSTALLTVGTGSSTVAASGLAFGNDSGANLYRSSTSTIKTDGNLIVAQNLTVTNHLSAATKSFLICHPSEKGKMLQYGSLESPYHGIRLTGKNKLINNSIIINLPSYISNLVSEEGINIQITNINHDKVLYVKQINIKENNFVVGVSCLLSSECEFYWSFTAIRKDVPMLEVEYQLKYG